MADWYLLWDQSYGDFKKRTFRQRHSNLFASSVARVGGGGKVVDFPLSTSQDLQPANQNGAPWVTYNLPSRFTRPQELARKTVNVNMIY
jgi:hypothetical protein